MKTIKKLINGECNKLGNHKREITEDNRILYYYHQTVICEVNHNTKNVIITDGGWKTSSTTRAINSYIRETAYLIEKGYTLQNYR